MVNREIMLEASICITNPLKAFPSWMPEKYDNCELYLVSRQIISLHISWKQFICCSSSKLCDIRLEGCLKD